MDGDWDRGEEMPRIASPKALGSHTDLALSFDTTLSCVFSTSISDRKDDQMSGASVRWCLKVGGADTKVHSNGSGEWEGKIGLVTVYCWMRSAGLRA